MAGQMFKFVCVFLCFNVVLCQLDKVCQTSDGTVVSCVSLFSCEPYLKLTEKAKSNPEYVNILRKAHCGFEENIPKVCCSRPGIPNTRPTAVTPPATSPPVSVESRASDKNQFRDDFISALPEPPECGISNATLPRVIDGIPAKLGAFPWMALLGYRKTTRLTGKWNCGGSLVSSHHVLTAAHCIHNHEDDLYVVRLGELVISKDDDGATPIDVLIRDMIKHEKYAKRSNDIGILVLERDVEFTRYIRPICIPTDSKLRAMSFEGYNSMVAGWGYTESGGSPADHLQVVQVPVESNWECARAYSRTEAKFSIDGRVICAGYKNGGKDACTGDSGGPLMHIIWNDQTFVTYYYQIGVVAFGKRCALPGVPGVYTRVTSFVPWLQRTLLGA